MAASIDGFDESLGLSTDAEYAAFVHDRFGTAGVLHVYGEVDHHNSPSFEAALEAAMRAEMPLVVDLCECRYFDAAAISVLVRAFARLGNRLRVAADPHSAPHRILQVTEMPSLFCVGAGVSEVLSAK